MEIQIDEVLRVEQLPEIFQQLDVISEFVVSKVDELKDVVCNEENKQEVKKYRTSINSMKTLLENKRKEIKKQILAPYEEFEEYYDTKVKNILDNGIATLDKKIEEVENIQLKQKQKVIEDFFNEWQEYYHLEDIIKFEDVPIKINLSNSEKSLKEQTKEFLEKVSNDIECISSDTYRDRILNEYLKNGFDYSKATLTIKKQNDELERLKIIAENTIKQEEKEQKVIEKVEEVATPIEIKPKREIVIKFYLENEEIAKLNEFLLKNNYQYEIV